MKDEIQKENQLPAMLDQETDLAVLFSSDDKLDTILTTIETETLAIAPDLSTTKGRKAVASLAYKVSRSKTALDDAGKKLNEDAQAKIAAVNAQRKKVKDRLDELRDKVRKPLEDWEAAEETRKAAHRQNLQSLHDAKTDWQMSTTDIQAIKDQVESVVIDESWEEFKEMAEEAKAKALDKITADLQTATMREAQEAEIARLKKEADERAKKDAEEAEARAKEEAERKAKEEAEARAKAEAEAAEKHKAEKVANIKALIAECEDGTINNQPASLAVRIFELEHKLIITDDIADHADDLNHRRDTALESLRKQLAEEEAKEQERREAEKEEALKAEREERERREKEAAENAAKEERERLQREREEAERARQARERDEAHRKNILHSMNEAITAYAIGDVAQAIMDEKIPHVRVLL